MTFYSYASDHWYYGDGEVIGKGGNVNYVDTTILYIENLVENGLERLGIVG